MNLSKIKKLAFLTGLTSLVVVTGALSGCSNPPELLKTNICMITDTGDITDESFNQNTWEGCLSFGKIAEEHGVKAKITYKKPSSKDVASLIETIELAIDQGYGTIVLPGFTFGEAIKDVAPRYPEVKFISLDTEQSSFGQDYVLPENVFSCIYQDELAGFMAGYAAASEGYTSFGFLGGQAVTSVKRFGYGFVHGIDYFVDSHFATLNSKYLIRYVYGNQFFGDSDIKARMDTWYRDCNNPTQVVFCCGGGIYTSACEAALGAATESYVQKVIGVDVDQGPTINKKYCEHMCITSAMKGLKITVEYMLYDYVIQNNWSSGYYRLSFSENFLTDKNPQKNFVQLPNSSFGLDGHQKELFNFTYDDYCALALEICKANSNTSDCDKKLQEFIKVDISKNEPTIRSKEIITFENQGNIK